ncbi:MAG: hypothetical protein CMF49_05940 [Legionellales bacterium]|nr:hypothetical protein [Legionellales bacterium]
MAAVKRKKDTHLPKRVHFKHGSYYYITHSYKWINLGKTLSEAMANWVDIVQPDKHIHTMNQLFDRYMAEIAPKKAQATFRSNLQEIKVLKAVFGDQSPDKIDAVKVYQFLDRRGKISPTRANREKALLSHIFTKGIRWGVVRDNPCKGVESLPSKRRNRYITDIELNSIKSIADSTMRLIIEFAYLTGLRQGDVLKLKLDDITADGIFVLISKTQNKILINWTEKLKHVVEHAMQLAYDKKSLYLFSTKQGEKFTSSGFQSNWQKLIRKAMGLHYDIFAIEMNEELLTKTIIEEVLNTKLPVPTLIKNKNIYYFWGRCKQGKLKLTQLQNMSVNISFPQLKKRKLLNGNVLPKQLYDLIELNKAHVPQKALLTERFTFHDIRRKTATDIEAKKDRETARKLLGHSDQKMTGRYISGVQKVWPIE